MPHDDDAGMVKTGVDEKAEARAAAAELRRRLDGLEKTASNSAMRERLEAQLEAAEEKARG